MDDHQPEIKPPIALVTCPRCGRPASTTRTRFGVRHDCWTCRTRSWDGKPMVTRSTLQARSDAHRAFDPLWQLTDPDHATEADAEKLLARSRAYKLLAEELGMDVKDVHMSTATEEVSLRVPAAVDNIKIKLAMRTPEQIMRDYRERGKEIADARRVTNDKRRKLTS